jgi:hypothetical protein
MIAFDANWKKGGGRAQNHSRECTSLHDRICYGCY